MTKNEAEFRLIEYIKERRVSLNISQTEMANHLGLVSNSFLSALEAGRAKFPVRRWEDFATILETPKKEFLQLVLNAYYPSMAKTLFE